MSKDRGDLITYLQKFPPGEVKSTSDLEVLLAASWDTFSGWDAGGMRAYKLHGRIEQPEWKPPILTFQIERHGSTVCGSTRAEMQHWEVDINSWEARLCGGTHRQLKPTAPRLDVGPLATAISQLIVNRKEDAQIKWLSQQRVRLQIGQIIPDTGSKQTLAGRRKRFRAALDKLLSASGWRRVGPNDYERTS